MDIIDQYNNEYKQTLIEHLEIIFLQTNENIIQATMPVTVHTSQPFGYLSGGASLALAESIAGHGSRLLCSKNHIPCGIQVSGNHLIAVPIGKTVTGTGRLIHQGETMHVWNIDITDNDGRLVSTVRVVNYITTKTRGTD